MRSKPKNGRATNLVTNRVTKLPTKLPTNLATNLATNLVPGRGSARTGARVERQKIIDAIGVIEKQLGRVPRKVEFHARSGIREHALQCVFSNWGEAMKAAGHSPYHRNPRNEEELLADWGAVAQKLGRQPKRDEYNRLGEFSVHLWKKCFPKWREAAQLFCNFARGKRQWRELVEKLERNGVTPRRASRREGEAPATGILLGGSPIDTFRWKGGWRRRSRSAYGALAYGDPIDFRRLRNAPVNESGVILLFGMIAAELGLMIEAVQPGFPDCEAKYKAEDGKWRRLRIEFEYESRNFVLHGHEADGCDVIVCWKHNWKECPLQVIELSSCVKELKAA